MSQSTPSTLERFATGGATTTPDGTRHHRQWAYLMVAGATMGLAFKGIFARLAYAEGLSVVGVLLIRVLMAAPLFVLGAVLLERRTSAGPNLGEHDAVREHLRALLSGSLFIGATLMDFMAIERIGAGPSRVILFVYPGFILLFDAMRERVWPSTRHLVVFGLAWTGLVMVATPNGLGALDEQMLTGACMSLLAALSYAIFTVSSQRSVARLGSPRFVALSNTGAALMLVVGMVTVIDVEAIHVTQASTGWMVAMVLVSTVVPVFMMFEGIGRLGASRVSLLMLMGPPMTVLAAWVVLGEQLEPLQAVGTVLVVVAMGVLRGDSATPRQDRIPHKDRALHKDRDLHPNSAPHRDSP